MTAFCLVGAALVVVKHRANIRRLLAGTENRIGDGPMRQTLLRGLHVLALGFWFGGAAFFNFVAAPTIFDSFKQVVNDGPSDRTANQTIIPADATDADEERPRQCSGRVGGRADLPAVLPDAGDLRRGRARHRPELVPRRAGAVGPPLAGLL